MKRTFSFVNFRQGRHLLLVVGGTGLIAASYGLVRLAFGLYLPDVQAELGLDASLAGVISGGSSAMYCVAAIAGFFLAAHLPRGLVIAAASTAAGGALGMAVSAQVAMFAVSAVVSSAGAGLASPALVELLRRSVTGARGSRFQVMVNAGTGPGLVLAGALALLLLPNWRMAWALAAVVTVLAAAAVLLASARAGEREGEREAGHEVGRALPPPHWFAAHLRPVFAALLLGAGSAAVWTFGRSVLAEAGASPTLSAVAWMCLGLGGVLVLPLSVGIRALGSTRAWALTSLVVAGSTVLIGVLPGAWMLALAACVAFGWGYTAATGALITWTSEIDDRRASAGTALLFVVLILGQGVGASLAGWGLGVASPALVFTISAAVSVAAVVPACVGGALLRGMRLAQQGRFGHEGELVCRGSAVE